jgi:hypothetical protein
MEEIEDQITDAVERLAEDFHLSARAKRLLHLYFEIILFELVPDQEKRSIDPKQVETFMRSLVDTISRVDSRLLPRGLRSVLRVSRSEAPEDTRVEISASELLHMSDPFRGPYARYFDYPRSSWHDFFFELMHSSTSFGESGQVLRFVMDKD